MADLRRDFDSIRPEDFAECPVWELVTEDYDFDGVPVVPVPEVPVSDLGGRLVGARVKLACGDEVHAWIGNVELDNEFATSQFVTLTIASNGKWFPLARYFDVRAEEFGPEKLATFLGKKLHDVFPISIDLRQYCIGLPGSTVFKVPAEPEKKLTDDELNDLLLS